MFKDNVFVFGAPGDGVGGLKISFVFNPHVASTVINQGTGSHTGDKAGKCLNRQHTRNSRHFFAVAFGANQNVVAVQPGAGRAVVGRLNGERERFTPAGRQFNSITRKRDPFRGQTLHPKLELFLALATIKQVNTDAGFFAGDCFYIDRVDNDAKLAGGAVTLGAAAVEWASAACQGAGTSLSGTRLIIIGVIIPCFRFAVEHGLGWLRQCRCGITQCHAHQFGRGEPSFGVFFQRPQNNGLYLMGNFGLNLLRAWWLLAGVCQYCIRD